ncbi:MAG TPA: hypothetical protein VD926_10370 [Acidimicrobiales bacterium]|nr:hypothetical protein [Acidimicrobiales bacterium]
MVVTPATVDRVLGEPDPVLRNLLVSVTYGRLADEFTQLVGPGNGAWVQFAAWTSEDVGLAIRGQQTERRWLLRLVRRFRSDYEELAEQASTAFSEGNTDVFRQVGACFVGFHDALRAGGAGPMDRFLAGLDGQVHGGGGVPEVRLVDAFTAYAAAAGAEPEDERGRAHSVALGNLALAVIEQSRVQGPIDRAFSILGADLPGWARSWTPRVVTELALEVTMGDVHIRPGKGLPPGLSVAPNLADLVVADDRFRAYKSVLPPDPPDCRRWTDLDERVTFIAALMPLLQQSPRLLGTSPFTDEEKEQIEAGSVPERFQRQDGR